MRVGLIGTGFGTNVHLPAFGVCTDIEVTAVCSAQLARAKHAAARFDIAAYTDDYRELVARDDVDLVDICTPPSSHLEIALAALEARKHVLCEKPIALNASDARRMRDAASEADRIAVVNHENRYTPVRRRMRDLVADGYLGAVGYVVAAVNTAHGTDPTKEPYYWGWVNEAAKGGGFLMGSLSHHIDLLRFVFGDIEAVAGGVTTLITERPVLAFEYRDGDPIDANSPTTGMRATDADDTAMFVGRLAGSGMVVVSGSWSLHHASGVRLEAYGSEGTLVLEPDGRLLGARRDDVGLTEISPQAALAPLPGAHYLVPHFAALATELADVVDGRRTPSETILPTFEDGYQLQRIIDAIKHPPVGS